jgi:hypothetical protein
MAVTNRLASTRLVSGESSGEVTVTPPGDGLALRLVTTAITERSQASLVVRDSQGRSMGKIICQDGDDKRLRLEAFESGDLVFEVECNLGTVDVQVDELTGHDATFPAADTSGAAQSGTADIEDDAITTPKLAAGAATLPKVGTAGTKSLVAAGRSGAGVVALSGTVIGDRVFLVIGTVTAGTGPLLDSDGDFESVITVDDEIQQSAGGDLSANTYQFFLIPAEA